MFGKKVQIESKCHATGEPVYLEQDGSVVIDSKPSKNVHFGIIWSSPTGCCAHSLSEHLFGFTMQLLWTHFSLRHLR